MHCADGFQTRKLQLIIVDVNAVEIIIPALMSTAET